MVETTDPAHILAPYSKIPAETAASSLDESTENNSETIGVHENDLMQLLILRMEEHIATVQPFRKPEFNIVSLSNALNVPQHHIAFIFKHVFKKSFVDFRNELRVNYVKECLKKGMLNNMTIEAIFTDAGFSSKTNFYAVFSKYTGMSPMQYLG